MGYSIFEIRTLTARVSQRTLWCSKSTVVNMQCESHCMFYYYHLFLQFNFLCAFQFCMCADFITCVHVHVHSLEGTLNVMLSNQTSSKSLAKNMQSNGWPFISWTFCRIHWTLNSSSKGLILSSGLHAFYCLKKMNPIIISGLPEVAHNSDLSANSSCK